MAGSRFSNLKFKTSEFQPEFTKTFTSIAKLTPSILHLKDAVESNSKVVAITSAANSARKSRTASSIAALPAAVGQSPSIQSLVKGIDSLSSSPQDPNLSVKDRSAANSQLDKIDKKLALLTEVTKMTNTDQLADIEKILRTNQNVVSKLDKLSTTIVNVGRSASNDATKLSRKEDTHEQARLRQLIGALENPNIYLNQSVDSVTKTLLITNDLLKDLIKESENQTKLAKDQAKGSGGGLMDLLGSLLGGGLGGRLGRRRMPGGRRPGGRTPGRTSGRSSPQTRRTPGGEAFRENRSRTTGTRTPPRSGSRTAAKAATLGTVAAGTEVAEHAAEKSTGKAVAKTAGKSLVKKIPLVGALAGLGFAAGRAWDGDWSGAGLEALSGVASIVPVVGTAASVALDAALLAKDLSEEGEESLPDNSEAPEIDSEAIGEEIGDKVKEALEDTDIKVSVPKSLVSNQSNNLNAVAGTSSAQPQLNSQGVPVTLAPMTKSLPAPPPSVSNALRNSAQGLPSSISTGMGSLSDTIAKFESKGDYNIYNQGAGHRYKVGRTDFSQMTLDEVLARQTLDKNDPNKLFAIGKYQIIPDTLKEAKAKLGLKGDEMFTPEMQDRIFTDYLMESKRPELANMIRTGQGVEQAKLSGAKEWASIGVAGKGDRSYYAGDGINKAHLSSGQFESSLLSAHEAYKANIANGMPEDEAYRQAILGKVPQVTPQASTSQVANTSGNIKSILDTTTDTPIQNRNLAFPKSEEDKGLFDQGRDALSTFAKSMGYEDIGSRLKSKPDLRLAVGPLSNEIVADPKYTPKGWKGSGFELGRGIPDAPETLSTTRTGQSRYNLIPQTVESSTANSRVDSSPTIASTSLSPTADSVQTNTSGVIPIADLSKLEVGSKVGSNTNANHRGNLAAANNPLDSNRSTPSHGMKGSESPTHIDDLGIVLINTGML